MIKAQSLVKIYRRGATAVTALDVLSLDIATREFAALLGPSGAGKTTTLNLIGGMDMPDTGTIKIEGEELTRRNAVRVRREKIGFVFSEFFLIPTLNAVENVMVPLLWATNVSRREKQGDHRQAARLLDMVEMGHRASHYPRELSGGEMQRVAIARALVNTPAIVLADEPTANLDTGTRDNVMGLFRRLNRENGITIVIATHDLELAGQTGKIIRIEDGKIAG